MCLHPEVIFTNFLHADCLMAEQIAPMQLDYATTFIVTRRLLLRPLGVEDVSAVYEAASASQSEIGRWMDWCKPDLQVSDTREFVQSRMPLWEIDAEYSFGIFDRGDCLVGCCGLNQVSRLHRTANLGYWVRSSETLKGYATEAGQGLAKFGFDTLGLSRLEIMVMCENAASASVAEKIGAKFEGIARNRMQWNGGSHDARIFGLLRDDL